MQLTTPQAKNEKAVAPTTARPTQKSFRSDEEGCLLKSEADTPN
jgi:hypothetical protein